MSFKKIFFDLDGTLIDSSKRSYCAYKKILKGFGKKYLSEKIYLQLKRKKVSIEAILKKSNAEKDIKIFEKNWKKIIETNYFLKYNRLISGVIPLLKELSRSYDLFLITLRKDKSCLIKELRRMKIFPYFKKIIRIKPGEERYIAKLKAIKKFAKKNDIIIGDSETDIRAGKKLKIFTIAVSNGWRNKNILKKEKPNLIINKITDLKI